MRPSPHVIYPCYHPLPTTAARPIWRATDPARRDHALYQITISVDRTSRLVRQLLELARQEGRETEPANRFARVSRVVSGVASDYAHLAATSNRSIVAACGLRDLDLAIDADSLRLALGNLVGHDLQPFRTGTVPIDCASTGSTS